MLFLRQRYDTASILCQECDSQKEAVIVPPTYFKEYSNYFLNQVWHQAEQGLREAEKTFFCGYSIPDADMHIKYLLKRIETNRERKPLQIYVANGHYDKTLAERTAEESRFNRFFIGPVNYLEDDFDGLVKNIDRYL